MDLRILSRGAIGAVAGATMLALSSAPSSAFTLSSPSLEQPVVGADVESVWWHGGWHRGWHGGWHRGWRRERSNHEPEQGSADFESCHALPPVMF